MIEGQEMGRQRTLSIKEAALKAQKGTAIKTRYDSKTETIRVERKREKTEKRSVMCITM